MERDLKSLMIQILTQTWRGGVVGSVRRRGLLINMVPLEKRDLICEHTDLLRSNLQILSDTAVIEFFKIEEDLAADKTEIHLKPSSNL